METGLTAIEAALRERYPGQTFIAGAQLEPRARSPLAEVRVYEHPLGHWHYVTLGFSELGQETSDDPDRSGWGFELTLRLAKVGDAGPPRWPVRALHQLARYVFDAKAPFAAGHHMDLGGPVDDAAPEITGFGFAPEPELKPLTTANGHVVFVLVVGVLSNEEAVMARWSVRSFLELLQQRTSLLVTRPDRPSLLDDPELGPMIAERVEKEGSPPAVAVAEVLSWRSPRWLSRKIKVTIGPATLVRRNLTLMLGACIEHGTGFRIVGDSGELGVEPGDVASWEAQGSTLRLTVSRRLADEIRSFLDGRGRGFESSLLPGFTLKLVD
jgi:suppressor of fused